MTRLAMYQNSFYPYIFSPQICKYPLIYKAPVSIEKDLSLSFASKIKIKVKRAAGSFSENVAYALKSIWALLRKNSIWKSSFEKEKRTFFAAFWSIQNENINSKVCFLKRVLLFLQGGDLSLTWRGSLGFGKEDIQWWFVLFWA